MSQSYLALNFSATLAVTSIDRACPSITNGWSPSSRASETAEFAFKLRALTLSGLVQTYQRPPSRTNQMGTRWGRPSGRTVANQTFRASFGSGDRLIKGIIQPFRFVLGILYAGGH